MQVISSTQPPTHSTHPVEVEELKKEEQSSTNLPTYLPLLSLLACFIWVNDST